MRTIAAAPGLAVVVLLAAASGAVGETLPQERCEALAGERVLLEGGEVGEHFRKGPDWGKANLKPEQLAHIQRLIVVRENLLFRCRSFDAVRDAPQPSIAPDKVPEPVRRPQPPPGTVVAKDRGDVPVPERPQRDAGDGDASTAAAGKALHLRGTVSHQPQSLGAAVPPPARKVRPSTGTP